MIDERFSSAASATIYSSDHDYFFWSPALGEAFLSTDGVLHFFDGETLTVVGYPMLGSQPSFSGLLSAWLQNPDVHAISYVGSQPIMLPPPYRAAFAVVHHEGPEEYNVDITVGLASPYFLKTRNAKDSSKRVLRERIEVRQYRQTCLSARQIQLIRALAVRSSVNLSGTAYILGVQSVLPHSSTLVFEASVRNSTVGFAVAHSYFPSHPFLVAVASQRGVPAVADALYLALFRHYSEGGAKHLGLGYSVDEGSFRYKMKWGGAHAAPPYFQIIWRRLTSHHVYVCFDWRVRLLSQKFRDGVD